MIGQFLTQVLLHLNFYIPVARRLDYPGSKHRGKLGKFPVGSELDLILKHGNRLRANHHGWSKRTTQSATERNQLAINSYKAKRIEFNNKARLANGKQLFLKFEIQIEFLEASLPDPEPVVGENQIGVVESEKVKDSGSVLKCFRQDTDYDLIRYQ